MKLLNELNQRLKFLESEPDNAENTYRINELSLCIVRVQQLILEKVKLKKNNLKPHNTHEQE